MIIPIHKAIALGSISSAAALTWTPTAWKTFTCPCHRLPGSRRKSSFALSLDFSWTGLPLESPGRAGSFPNTTEIRSPVSFSHEFWVMPQHGLSFSPCHDVQFLTKAFQVGVQLGWSRLCCSWAGRKQQSLDINVMDMSTWGNVWHQLRQYQQLCRAQLSGLICCLE